MTALSHASVSELIIQLETGEVSALELVRSALERIEATQATLNTFTTIRDPDASLADARRADERRARGEARPLEGIPFGVKDLEDVAGMVTSYGSVPFRDNVAERDSPQVERLQAAGAILAAPPSPVNFIITFRSSLP